jgi:carboxyl-terminal processing protease
VVERQPSKLNVEGSNPFARFHRGGFGAACATLPRTPRSSIHLASGLALLLLAASATGCPDPRAAPGWPPHLSTRACEPEAVFQEACRLVRERFYDPAMNGVDWDAVASELRPRARLAATPAELSAVINEALGRLHASHTRHYTPDQREYYELLDVFFPDGVPARFGAAVTGPVAYTGIGLAAERIDSRDFAADVYDGGPAQAAGILPGDELLGVEDGPWGDVAPFRGREGRPTRVTIQRTADPASRREVFVNPRRIRPRDLFTASIHASARIIPRPEGRIAFLRVRSYSNPRYHEEVKVLLRGTLAGADGLILDLRGGWGGASPEYMDIFNPVAPALEFRRRGEEARMYEPSWRKPAVMLIDGGTRSGKEVLAYAFKKHRLGQLVGETTAGAVLGGTPYILSDSSLLYIAGSDVRVDGQRLEGAGVEPDTRVARRLPYAAGADPQLDAALDALATRLRDAAARGDPPADPR